jgi:predicted HTH domain antitoxin
MYTLWSQHMQSIDTFTIRDLRERTGDLARDAESGRLSIITKHGHPLFVAVPFSQELLEKGAGFSLALQLFTEGVVTSSRAAKIAGIPLAIFLEDVSNMGVPVVDYPVEEIEHEMKVLEE